MLKKKKTLNIYYVAPSGEKIADLCPRIHANIHYKT